MLIVDKKELEWLKSQIKYDALLYLDTETIDLSKSIVPSGARRDVRLIQLYQEHWTESVMVDCFLVDIDEVLKIIDPLTWVIYNVSFDLKKLERLEKENYVDLMLIAKALLPLYPKLIPNPAFDPSKPVDWNTNKREILDVDGASYSLDNVCKTLQVTMNDVDFYIQNHIGDMLTLLNRKYTRVELHEGKFVSFVKSTAKNPMHTEIVVDSKGKEKVQGYRLVELDMKAVKPLLQKSDWSTTLLPIQLEYAAQDAEVLCKLYKTIMPMYSQCEYAQTNYTINKQVTTMLLKASKQGLYVNKPLLQEERNKVCLERHKLALDFPTELDLKSTKEVPLYLGTESSDKLTLVQLTFEGSEVLKAKASSILKVRKADKSLEFIDKYMDKEFVQGTIKCAPTTTQRMSSEKENLQNIPRNLKFALGCKEGGEYMMVSCDYPAIELRLATTMYGVTNFYTAMQTGRDLHTATAAAVFGKPYEAFDKAIVGDTFERFLAKSMNFGLLYGMGVPTFRNNLIQDANIYKSVEEVKKYVEDWRRVNHEIANMQNRVKVAVADGGLFEGTTALGRPVKTHIYTKAMNYEVQGSGAELIKLAMLYMNEWLEQHKDKVQFIACIHDAIYLKSHVSMIDESSMMIKKAMTDAWNYMSQVSPRFVYKDITLPLDVHVGYGME